MDQSYICQLESEGIPVPTNAMEVITIMVDKMQDMMSEMDHMSSDEFASLSPKGKYEYLRELRKQMTHLQTDNRKLASLMAELFDNAYYNAVDCLCV